MVFFLDFHFYFTLPVFIKGGGKYQKIMRNMHP